jgi:hypothetical protein
LEAPEQVEADAWFTVDDLLGGPETILVAQATPGATRRAVLRVDSGKPADASIVVEPPPAQTSKGKG